MAGGSGRKDNPEGSKNGIVHRIDVGSLGTQNQGTKGGQ